MLRLTMPVIELAMLQVKQEQPGTGRLATAEGQVDLTA